jgi:esterase/lipase
MHSWRQNRNPGWKALVAGSLFVLLVIVFVLLTPWGSTSLAARPNPVQSYAEAMQRIEAMRSEPADMNPVCRLRLLTHDERTERAIVLVHGYTNCPEEYAELGRRLHEMGYNVLIAPLPHHGLRDRLTEDHARLTTQELVTYADDVVDAAQGLGERVTMLGISAGAVTTAWAAQQRRDIDLAVIISPNFGVRQIPRSLTVAAINLYGLLPNSFNWWDPVQKAEAPPAYTYPRNSTHALVQIFRLAFAVKVAANRAPPAAHRLIVVLNANDNAVNNPATMDVVRSWQRHGADVTTYEFEAALNLGHDIIDPGQPGQPIDAVYPRLISLIDR